MNKQQKIRVLHVVGCMNCGGTETMIMNLYRKIDKNRIQFDFVVHTNNQCYYDEEISLLGGIIYHCPRYTGINHFQYIKWWKDFFNKNTINIVHGHIGSTAAIYLRIAKNMGYLTIAHSHSTKMNIFYSMLSYPTRYVADYFLACSKIAGLCRFGESVVSSNNFNVLNNVVDVENYAYNINTRQLLRQTLKIDGSFVIGIVARITPVKNPIGVIDIFESVLEKINNAKLLWIGDGDSRRMVEMYIKEKNLEKFVIFTGVRNDVNNLLQAMDVFILPSISEGLGMATIEAQASGLPCVLSTGVPNEVDITGNCVFIPISDKHAWTKAIIDSRGIKRTDVLSKIMKRGYGIGVSAEWLSDYYFNLLYSRI